MTETQRPPFDSSLNEQRTEATIEIEGAKFVVTAEQLENTIAHLGLLRSKMLPAVPKTTQPNRILPLDFLEVERFGNTENPTGGGLFVYARSPYFGWFQIHMSPEWCSGLVPYLTGENLSPPPHATIN